MEDAHAGEDAVIVLGGPSILENRMDLARLADSETKIFLESKALTPRLLESGIVPDYYAMPYPEKAKCTAFQHMIFLAELGGIDLLPLVKPEFHPEVRELRENFGRYFEAWQPENPRKRFRWRRDAFLPGSPMELLGRLDATRLISYEAAFLAHASESQFRQPVHLYGIHEEQRAFDLRAYYSPRVEGGRLMLNDFGFSNSAAIGLFPLLLWMGFKRAFLVGMDMSMMGSMEYAALYTFRSHPHFRKFYDQARPLFSANFPGRREELLSALRLQTAARGRLALLDPRTWWRAVQHQRRFLRPPREFESVSQVLRAPGLAFVQVYEPFRFSKPIDGIPRVGYDQFWKEIGA